MSESDGGKSTGLINVTLVGDLSKPLVKTLDLIGKATGAVSESWLIKRKANAEAEAEKIAVRSELEIEAIRKRAHEREENRKVRRQINVERIREESVKYLMAGPEPNPADPVDEDWVDSFFEKCQDVGNEKMQALWARLLAGEIRKPGSYSQQTLDIIRRLPPKVAEYFNVAAMIRGQISFPAGPDLMCPLQPKALNYLGTREWLFLEDAGLVKLSSTGPRTLRQGEYGVKYAHWECRLIIPQNKTVSLTPALFTVAGEEVASLVEIKPSDFWNKLLDAWRKEGAETRELGPNMTVGKSTVSS